MKFLWEKLGNLYNPANARRHPKLLTHAANPVAIHLHGDVFRIFYSGRDSANRSSVGAVDIDITAKSIVTDHFAPFFEHGPEGSFYADGVSIGNTYKVAGTMYLLFMGWQNAPGSHWRGDIGRLIVTQDFELKMVDEVPLLACNATDPISLSYPWVMSGKTGGYDMWYGSTVTWGASNGEMVHTIKYASSDDGHKWQRNGEAIPFKIGVAQAFSRPTVIRTEKDGYEMWFSYRNGDGTPYRIGYAASPDGLKWRLDIESSGIQPSKTGWDSEMIEYPFVFDHKGIRYMLYNGNGYGRTGFGLAVLEQNSYATMST